MDRSSLIDLWTLPWSELGVLIGGQSSIDLTTLNINNYDEAQQFLAAYGFNPEEPRARRRLHAAMVEAITFIERFLVTPEEWSDPGLGPPSQLLGLVDPTELLVWAGGASAADPLLRNLAAWSCAVLRVMHTIAHIEGINGAVDFGSAREQIFQRFHQHISRGDDGRLWLTAPSGRVELLRVEWKEQKSRHSILLKLLHKRDNVAETLYDYLGVRLVTNRRIEAVLVAKLLSEANMVVYPNAYPARARNTLIDLAAIKANLSPLLAELRAGRLSPEDFDIALAAVDAGPKPDADEGGQKRRGSANPHSASAYQAIQLTGRQLVRVPASRLGLAERLGPGTGVLGSLRGELATLLVGPAADPGDPGLGEEYQESFFPFEIQILDREAFAASQSGEATHDRYKRSQVKAARKRVLGQVLEGARGAAS